MPRLNKHALWLTIVYMAVTALTLYCISYLLSKYFSVLADLISWGIASAFVLISVSGIYWNTALFIAGSRIRKPVLREEQRINRCLEKLKERSDKINNTRLRIVMTNTTQPLAYAVGRKTICISSGMLSVSGDDELCAVMAHEAGHIICRDTFFDAVFVSAYRCSVKINLAGRLPGKLLRHCPAFAKLITVITCIIAMLLQPLLTKNITIAILLWILVLQWTNTVAFKLRLYVGRLAEYRQDAFASSLGFGAALKTMLLKLYFIAPEPGATTWDLVHRSSHPILHHRIRAIEKLEGLRE